MTDYQPLLSRDHCRYSLDGYFNEKGGESHKVGASTKQLGSRGIRNWLYNNIRCRVSRKAAAILEKTSRETQEAYVEVCFMDPHSYPPYSAFLVSGIFWVRKLFFQHHQYEHIHMTESSGVGKCRHLHRCWHLDTCWDLRALKGFGEPFVPWCLGLSSAPLLLSPSAHSYDAVPFLMHDYDLSRTTNIREVLPSAAFNHTATFSWTFLSTLNAGQWFIQVGLVSSGSVDLCASLSCSGSSAAPGVSTFPASLGAGLTFSGGMQWVRPCCQPLLGRLMINL